MKPTMKAVLLPRWRAVLQRAGLVLALLAVAAAAPAQNAAPAAGDSTAPDVLVKSVSDEVLQIIRSDKDIRSGNHEKVMQLVEAKILPHFNFARMTALAVGPGWRKATPEQRTQLQDEFRALLVRTYSSGLSAYRDQTIEYKPLRLNPGDTEVTVKSEVKQANADPVTIDYRMQQTPEGWKVFDVAIAGVSLVTTYRDTFGQEVRKSGIDGLIAQLKEKNRQLAQSSQSASR